LGGAFRAPTDKTMAEQLNVKGQRWLLAILWTHLLALHQPFPYPTWVTAAIKDCKNHNPIVDDVVIYGEWKPFGELAVVSEKNLVNTSEICQ
jgi:hypothetical protein